MRSIIRMFVLAAVSASATAAFAFDRVTVNVPFNFETHGKTFPAGTYKVESAANHYSLTLSSKTDTKLSSTWIACPAEFGPNMSTLSLNFDIRANGTHALRSIRLGTLITPVLDVRERDSLNTQCPSPAAGSGGAPGASPFDVVPILMRNLSNQLTPPE